MRFTLIRLTLIACTFSGMVLGSTTAPFAANRIDLSKTPACAKGERSTAKKPCTVVKATPTCAKGQRSTAKKPCKAAKKSTPTPKFVAIPVCNPGQKSTTAKPCITLTDNGPPPSSKSSTTSTSTSTTTTKPAAATTTATTGPDNTLGLVGPHINSHLCRAANGTVFECQELPDYDPGNPSTVDYPSIGSG